MFGIRLRCVAMIDRRKEHFAVMIDFVRQPLRIETVRTKAHHENDEHQDRYGFVALAAHHRYFVISLNSLSAVEAPEVPGRSACSRQ